MSLGTTRKFNVEQLLNEYMGDDDVLLKVLRIKNALQPLEGYHISDQESGTTAYYGYLNKDGAWYIMKAVTSGSEVNYTYKAGASGYVWANRVAGVYASFDTTFS